jgi:hypothetical protein
MEMIDHLHQTLTEVFTDLTLEARMTGTEQDTPLWLGMWLCVKVCDGWIWATVERQGPIPLEIERTLIRQIGIPPEAARYPVAGQLVSPDTRRGRDHWLFFTYCWREAGHETAA